MPSSGVRPWESPAAREAYVRRLFDEIARVYDPMNLVLTLGLWRRWQRAFLRCANPQPGQRLLDVACGTADLTILLARAVGPQGEVVGVDLSPAMLAIGREKVRRAGLGNVHLIEGNALALPFADASFDGATVGFGLRNFADLDRALREMRRVVRPGGYVLSLEVSKPERPVIRELFHVYFYGVVPLLGRLAGKGAEPYAWLPRSLTLFPDRRGLERRFAQAGLVAVESWPLTWGAAALHRGRVPG